MKFYTTLLWLLFTTAVYGQIDSLIHAAASHGLKGDYYKAETGFQQALEICDDEKTQALILNNLALTYMFMDRPDTAAVLFQQVAQIYRSQNNNFRLTNTYINLGVLYKRTDQYPKALACYKKALHYNRNPLRSNSIRNNIATVYFDLKDYHTSLHYLNRHSNNPRILNNVARCFSRTGQADSAFYYFDRALSLIDTTRVSMEYIDILDSRAWLLYQQKKLPTALKLYKKAIQVHQQLRIDYLKQSKYLSNTTYQDIYCVAIEIAVKLNLQEEALLLSEENKSPVLREFITAPLLPADSILHQLPEGLTTLSYSYTDSLLVTILADRSGIETTFTPVAEDFTAAIDTFATYTSGYDDMSKNGYHAFVRASNTLYNYLVPPLPATTGRLLLCPYGELHRVNFDVLTADAPQPNFNFAGFDFLIRNYAISYAPSLNIYAHKTTVSDTINSSTLFISDHPDYPLIHSDEMIRTMRKQLPELQVADTFDMSLNTDLTLFYLHGITDHLLFRDDTLHHADIDSCSNNLTIINACNSGLGKTISNEGILSFGYAYLEAGSHSVMVATSEADEETSIMILSDFLENLKDGYPKDVALQRAKMTYLSGSQSFYAMPALWSNYLLYGDNSPVRFPRPFYHYILLIGAGLVMAGLFLFLGRRVVRKFML